MGNSVDCCVGEVHVCGDNKGSRFVVWHPRMASEDCSWVFDSLVGFLQGPIWNAPILTFIEQKSSGNSHNQYFNAILN